MNTVHIQRGVFCLVLAVFWSFFLFSQEQRPDIVYLNSGDSIIGKIQEYNPFKKMIIISLSGEIHELEVQVIKRVTRNSRPNTPEVMAPEAARSPEPKSINANYKNSHKKKISFYPGLVLMFGATQNNNNAGNQNMIQAPQNLLNETSFIFDFSIGYNITHYYSLGVGVAISMINSTQFANSTSQPGRANFGQSRARSFFGVFLDNRVSFLRKKIRPFIYTHVGYGIATIANGEAQRGGVVAEGGGGVKLYTSPSFALGISLGFYYHENHYETPFQTYDPATQQTVTRMASVLEIYQRVPIRITLQF